MARVDFDFEGSLELARELWDLADSLPALERRRSDGSDNASKDWQGAHGDRFRLQSDSEPEAFSNAEERLRAAANSWASAWARATDEQNQRDHADEVEAERESRGSGEQFVDWFMGDDSAEVVGPAPDPVSTPTGPRFSPTS